MSDTTYVCCFCYERIEKIHSDPAALIYIPNIDKLAEAENDASQQLYCHGACLQKHIDVRVPMYPFDLEDTKTEN